MGMFKRKLGGLAVTFLKKGNAAKSQKAMARVMTRQPIVDKFVSHNARKAGISKGRARDDMASHIFLSNAVAGQSTLGTLAKGKKGHRLFIDLNKTPKGKLREIVAHEKFHTVPVLGNSEVLAHAFGGLFSKRKTLSPGQAVRSVGDLLKARPGRASFELAAAGGTAYAAKEAVSRPKKPKLPKDVVFRRVNGRIVPMRKGN